MSEIVKPYEKPDDYSQLNPQSHLFVMARAPNVLYYAQRVTFPGLMIGETPAPFRGFADIARPGEKVVYDPFILAFMIDEKMINWFEIHDWMTEQMDVITMSDGILTLMSNLGNPLFRVRFVNCWPSMLTPPEFDTTVGPDSGPLQASVTLKFDFMEKIVEP